MEQTFAQFSINWAKIYRFYYNNSSMSKLKYIWGTSKSINISTKLCFDGQIFIRVEYTIPPDPFPPPTNLTIIYDSVRNINIP